MRFSLTKEYKEFFYRNKHIEFEDVLSLDQVADLKIALHKELSLRDPKIFKPGTPNYGRDLFRTNSEVKKIAQSRKYPHVISELISKSLFRLAFDLFLSPRLTGNSYFGKPTTFKEGSCLQELQAILIIRLGGSHIETPPETPFIPSPSKIGSLVVIHPELLINLEALTQDKDQELYIMAYGSDKLCYSPNELDPATPLLKRLGHVFGDLMKEGTHPIIYRS